MAKPGSEFRSGSVPTSQIGVAGPSRVRPLQPATVFTPQDGNLSPEDHFPVHTIFPAEGPPYLRFVNRFDSREILLVIEGSCINNGRHAVKNEGPKAGCSFVFKGASSSLHLGGDARPVVPPVTFPFAKATDQSGELGSASGNVAFRLERRGPCGAEIDNSSNRAKLRAAIAALQFRAWGAEGWRRVVVLTDLEYIALGATEWLPRWVGRQWRKPRGAGRYLNRDLWEELQECIDQLRERECEVSFWLVRRADEKESVWVDEAKAAARSAATTVQVEKFTRLYGTAP
ncbi:hypothetical protein B0H67DRAFT_648582 [Lasiosphaeris hirsuta]|uniref:RNase H type-1 domain-containing protein n=1 Tax=Lasiosphaeris hirsuta TaxID=260670 RepID=A0AA40DME4_9PEZI|nr:hypothetical protein B0H67DRAFT_648582 [Lasiosphaeris hirsuta]